MKPSNFHKKSYGTANFCVFTTSMDNVYYFQLVENERSPVKLSRLVKTVTKILTGLL